MKSPGGEQTFSFTDPPILMGGIAVLYLGCWAAWVFLHAEISAVYANIRHVELWIFSAIGDLTGIPGFSNIHDWIKQECRPGGGVSLCTRDMSTMKWSVIANSSIYFNITLFVGLCYMCIKMFMRLSKEHPKLNFTKSHNIASFVKESLPLYPHLSMFNSLDLIGAPLDDPILGMSETSRQFAFKNKLIAGWKEELDGSLTPSIDRLKAKIVFVNQLGSVWKNSSALSVGETIIAAITMPKVAATDTSMSDKDFAEAIEISEKMVVWCWSWFVKDGEDLKWLKPEIDLTYPREIISKYIAHPNIVNVIKSHAFNRTILFSLMLQARRLGVLPPADVRWLRFFDKELWYVVQTIGRQGGFSQGAAVLTHYLYEAKQRASILEPQVDKAINALELALTAFKMSEKDKSAYDKDAIPEITNKA